MLQKKSTNNQDEIAIKNRLAAIVEFSDDAIIGKDMDGIITDWNLGAKKIYGYAPEEIVGKPIATLAPTYKASEMAQIMDKVRAGIAIDHHQTKRIRKDGRVIDVSVTVSPIRDSKGKIVGASEITRDITEQMQITRNLEFLAEASRILASSLDYQETLNLIVKLACPFIADWCVIEMVSEEGKREILAIAHKDPALAEWAKNSRENLLRKTGDKPALSKALMAGQTEFYPEITLEMIKGAAGDEEHLEILKNLKLTSAIAVPLRAQGKTIGVFTFISSESKRVFNRNDLYMAEQLGDRASMAIENAKLFHAVRQEQKRLNNLLANVPGVVWEAWGDPGQAKQNIDFVSKHVEQMLGYQTEEWLETPNFWLKIVHPEDYQRAAKEAEEIFKSGKIGVSRFRWMKKTGGFVWVEAHSFVVKDKTGKPIGMRGVTMDISERVEIERRKDEFISMASHELKTPITSIKVFIEVLKNISEKQGYSEVNSYLLKMDRQVEKLSNLVSDLLDVSKIQAGKLELKREEFPLEDVVSETVEVLQAMTKRHNIKTFGRIGSNIQADRDRISQVLVNLLTNAIKYSPEAKRININLYKEDGRAIVSVQDFGVGIAKEHQGKIFERFFRVYDDADKTFPGLGMGLYISSQIVKQHGGEMWFKSDKDAGATFYVGLPLAQTQ